MQLQDYFEVEKYQFEDVGPVEKIRFKGLRITLEDVITPYLEGDSPERIYQGYRHSLSLEQVYGAITYYLHNKDALEGYFRRNREVADIWRDKLMAQIPADRLEKLRSMKQDAALGES